MSSFGLTQDQKNAVYSHSSSVLVSAAAGSGKTRVLTERLMAYVTDNENPKDISSFLIITYTRAAAAELRSRILDELSRRSAEEPENRRLRRQVTLCYRAQIGTIHSFCTQILREYCHKVGLTPDFRVGDEDKCSELREKALEKALDLAYEHVIEDGDFAALVESIGAGRDDSRLSSAVLELHGKMLSHPYPEKWVDIQLASLDTSKLHDANDTGWGRELTENARRTALYWAERLESEWSSLCANETENAPIISAYGESLGETMDALRVFIHALDLGWDRAANALPIPFLRLKPLKKYDFEERKASLISARESCKDACKSLCAVFDSPSDKLLSELAITAPAMRALLRLTLETDRLYAAEKRRLNLLDFSDLEHFAVKLLCDPETNEATGAARDISRRYTEIMVDEYQDVNAVQDLLFRCVSQGENNIFMVGDVKQSIYRFRLADPSIFIKKYHEFKEFVSTGENVPQKILLQSNFRSDRNILAACNHVFRNTMSESLGEISYDEDAALMPPDDSPLPRGKTELAILAVPQAEDGEERPDKTYLEAKMVARQIRQLVENSEMILDKGTERPVRYGDIAILLRSPNVAGMAFRRALSEEKVPVFAEQGGGFFTSPEIQIVRSLLSVIDNPHRDIPLASILSSPVFGFTADELSEVRAADRASGFYAALTKAADTSDKCKAFIETLSELRAISDDIGVYELLCLIYGRLELPAVFAASSGSSGSGNLMLLLEYAAKFEENGYRGLFGFLKQLTRMEERGEEPVVTTSGAGNAVAIMSIHKSKGLEFPVVFLANTSRQFNKMDLRSPVLIHPELGLGCKRTDTERGIEYPTLARRAIASRLNSEMLSEEVRVLYVAMTRAKERLYISCASKDPEALIVKLSENLSSPVNPEILKSLPSMAHWLVTAALIENDGLITIRTETPDSAEETIWGETEIPIPETKVPDTAALHELRSVFYWRYPFESAVGLPSKLTATSLPQDDGDDDGEKVAKERTHYFSLPDFAGDEHPLSGSERGTATHIVMQFIDFSKTKTLSDIEGEVARIKLLGQLTERQAKAVDRASILGFFASDTGARIKAADMVHREKRFSLLCPAGMFFPKGGNESVLLQGVVDCCIEEAGCLTIIDYKTDFVTQETLSDLTEHYRKQLLAYAYAMSRILGNPVSSCLLCFLRAGLVSEIKPL
ncbi:MAG: helicase-exonuclease AddAB subunit AddA [Firmicutes bacterium HGW-Firmicutes-16]|nr:MAG: helicase-exonuclease AddAB subunit AddA [Firmicutes bacterium HGW-Firmicutes-16]